MRQHIHCKQMPGKYAVSPRAILEPMADARKTAHIHAYSELLTKHPTDDDNDEHIQEAIALDSM